jgi:RNA polymerase sigma-70 factor (ECF subfamily)
MGDSQALDHVLSSIRPVVVRYCRARVGRRDQSYSPADAVAKEIIHAVLTALPGNQRALMELVYAIAVRKVDAALAECHGRVGAGPDLLVPWLLDELPTYQREIIVLRVAVGFTAEQVAEAMGRTASSIRLAQHRALNQLRKATEAVNAVPEQSSPGPRQACPAGRTGTAGG